MKRFILTACLVLGITIMFDLETKTGVVWENNARSDACIIVTQDSGKLFTTTGKVVIETREELKQSLSYQWRMKGVPYFIGVISPSDPSLND